MIVEKLNIIIMNENKFSFEKLDAYREARLLVKQIYELQKKLPVDEKYALGSQIRRAAVSITANIAEGCGRLSLKEKVHFIGISFGSLMEVFSELQNAVDLGYIAETNLEKMRPQFIHISRMLSGLRNFYISELNRTISKPNLLKP